MEKDEWNMDLDDCGVHEPLVCTPRTRRQMEVYYSSMEHKLKGQPPLAGMSLRKQVHAVGSCHSGLEGFCESMGNIGWNTEQGLMAAIILQVGQHADAWSELFRDVGLMVLIGNLEEVGCFQSITEIRRVVSAVREAVTCLPEPGRCDCTLYPEASQGPLVQAIAQRVPGLCRRIRRVDSLLFRALAMMMRFSDATSWILRNKVSEVCGTEVAALMFEAWFKNMSWMPIVCTGDFNITSHVEANKQFRGDAERLVRLSGACAVRYRKVMSRLEDIPMYDSPNEVEFKMCLHGRCGVSCNVDETDSANAPHTHLPLRSEGELIKVGVATDSGMTFNINTRQAESTDAPYVAISHVWSQGVFSLRDSKMCSCAYMLLQRAAATVGVHHVWLDTVCIPSEGSARRLEIQRMHSIYSEALAGIIVDCDMLESLVEDPQVVIRIVSSDWNSRVWTMQEGILVNTGLLYTNQGFVTLRRILKSAIINDCGPVVDRAAMTLDAVSRRLTNLPLSTVVVWARGRATSKAADFCNGLAALTGVSYYSPDPQMAYEGLVRSGALIDQSVLYRKVKRSTSVGLCWAPASLDELYSNESSGRYLQASINGLIATIRTIHSLNIKYRMKFRLTSEETLCLVEAFSYNLHPDLSAGYNLHPDLSAGSGTLNALILREGNPTWHYVTATSILKEEGKLLLTSGDRKTVMIAGVWSHPPKKLSNDHEPNVPVMVARGSRDLPHIPLGGDVNVRSVTAPELEWPKPIAASEQTSAEDRGSCWL